MVMVHRIHIQATKFNTLLHLLRKKDRSESQAGCRAGKAVHMAHTVSHEEQVDRQLAEDRQAQTRRQWTEVLSKGGWRRISESKVKGKPKPSLLQVK